MKNKKLKSCFFLGVCAISILSFTQKTKAATDTEANVNTELNLPYRIPDKAAYEDVEDLDLSETQYDVNPETSSKDIHFFGQDFTGENAAKYMMIPDFKFGNVQYKGKEVTVPAQKSKYTLNNGKEYEGLFMEYAVYDYKNSDDINFYVSASPFVNTNSKELKGVKFSIQDALYDLYTNKFINTSEKQRVIKLDNNSNLWEKTSILFNPTDNNKTKLFGNNISKIELTIPSNTTIEDGTKYTSTWTWTTEANPLPETIQYDGMWGTSPYTFDKNTGELVIYSGELVDVYTDNGENGLGGYIGKQLNRDDVKSIRFVGHVVAPANSFALFSTWKNMKLFDGTNLDTSKVTNMRDMFIRCEFLTNLDVSNFDTSNVTNMDSMFGGCPSLTSLDLSNWNTSKVTNMQSMFNGCSSLTNLDVSNFNTSNVTDMNQMFMNCYALTSLDVSNFNTSNVTDMNYMFGNYYNSSLTNLDVSNFDTSSVTRMDYMFSNCGSLTNLDVSNFNTSNVTKIGGMFNGCSSLTNLDVSNFNTSNVIYMQDMFAGCKALTSLDLSNFDTSNVRTMSYMFKGCNALTSLDISSFDTSIGTTMTWLFSNLNKLDTLKLGAKFKFPNDNYPSGTWKLQNGDIVFRNSEWYNYNGATDAGTYIKISE